MTRDLSRYIDALPSLQGELGPEKYVALQGGLRLLKALSLPEGVWLKNATHVSVHVRGLLKPKWHWYLWKPNPYSRKKGNSGDMAQNVTQYRREITPRAGVTDGGHSHRRR